MRCVWVLLLVVVVCIHLCDRETGRWWWAGMLPAQPAAHAASCPRSPPLPPRPPHLRLLSGASSPASQLKAATQAQTQYGLLARSPLSMMRYPSVPPSTVIVVRSTPRNRLAST